MDGPRLAKRGGTIYILVSEYVVRILTKLQSIWSSVHGLV